MEAVLDVEVLKKEKKDTGDMRIQLKDKGNRDQNPKTEYELRMKKELVGVSSSKMVHEVSGSMVEHEVFTKKVAKVISTSSIVLSEASSIEKSTTLVSSSRKVATKVYSRGKVKPQVSSNSKRTPKISSSRKLSSSKVGKGTSSSCKVDQEECSIDKSTTMVSLRSKVAPTLFIQSLKLPKVQSRALSHQKGRGRAKSWPGKDWSMRGKGCPHKLLIQKENGVGLQVLGAPKINPEVGTIASNPKKKNPKYIWCMVFS
jgi:hypothetical protein